MRKGKLIAIEGVDGVGKSTIMKMLKDNLTREDFSVHTLKFPSKDTRIGKLINAYLFKQTYFTPETLQLLYEADKYEFQFKLNNSLKTVDYVLIDRYLLSSIVYGKLRGLDISWMLQLQQGLIKPDITIVLDKPPVLENRKLLDIEEQNIIRIQKARGLFKSYYGLYNGVLINADKPIENVFNDVLDIVLGVREIG